MTAVTTIGEFEISIIQNEEDGYTARMMIATNNNHITIKNISEHNLVLLMDQMEIAKNDIITFINNEKIKTQFPKDFEILEVFYNEYKIVKDQKIVYPMSKALEITSNHYSELGLYSADEIQKIEEILIDKLGIEL